MTNRVGPSHRVGPFVCPKAAWVCMGSLTVTIGSVQYVYKLSDIVGRVEVSL